MGTAADLLFRIAGDSTPGQEELAKFRGIMATQLAGMAADSKAASGSFLYDWAGAPIRKIGSDFDAMGSQAASGLGRTASSSRHAKEAIRGLGEEIGVHMPRFVGSWLSGLGPVAGIMSAAFAPIAVVGLIDVLAKLPGELQKGIDWLHGWDEAAKKAFENSVKHAVAAEQAILEYNAQLREIALIGKEGIEKVNLELAINSQNFDAADDLLVKYLLRLNELKEVVNFQWHVTGPVVPFGAPEQQPGYQKGPSHEEVEKAKAEIAQLEPAIAELEKKIGDLHLKDLQTSAEDRADAAKTAAQRTEESAKWTADLEKRLTAQKEQTVAIREQEWQAEIDGLKAELAKEAQLTTEHLAQLTALWAAGYDKIEREDAARMAADGEKLQELAAKNTAAFLDDLIKRSAARVKVEDELRGTLEREQAEEQGDRARAIEVEIAQMRAKYAAEAPLTAAAEAMLADIRTARLDKLAAEQRAAFGEEMAALGEQLARIDHAHETEAQRIARQYEADVAGYKAAEDKKVAATKEGSAERAAIEQRYAAVRAGLLAKEQSDLQALQNSQGWQGVLGHGFAEMIRGNEKLSREWADSTNQSMMMVRVTLEGMKEMGQQAFDQLAQGMGSAIAHAIVYEQSIGKAMDASLKATLASISAQADVRAIEALALAFLDLAYGNFAGAGEAFASAALWGSIGTATAIAGRAIPSGQQGGAGASPGGGAGGSGGAGGGAAQGFAAPNGTAATDSRKRLTVHIYGNYYGSGIQQVASDLNDAVLNQGVTLTSTNTKTGTVVQR